MTRTQKQKVVIKAASIVLCRTCLQALLIFTPGLCQDHAPSAMAFVPLGYYVEFGGTWPVRPMELY